MGYRSEIYGKVLKKHEAEFNQMCSDMDIDYFETDTDDTYYYFKGDYLKWYDGHPEVDAINNWINELNKDGGMIVIGEDGAIFEYGAPWEVDLYTITTIDGSIL
jgi:hypothetical protein